MTPYQTFDLYLDESGKFYENSYDPAEAAAEEAGEGRKFPSQLAGLLAPAGHITEEAAEEILRACHARAGWRLPPVVHMKNYVGEAVAEGRATRFGREYNLLLTELFAQLRARDWQPVLLVNREGVSYGNMVQTYTNMVAELFLRACRRKGREGAGRMLLNLVCAEVQLQLPLKRRMKEEFYLWRLRETEALAAVRRGYAPESRDWRMGTVRIVSDDDSRALQICDVISHASHANFKWCSGATRAQFRELLGEYRWTMSFAEQLERIGGLVEDRSLGVALVALTELFVLEDDRQQILGEAGALLSRVLDELAEMAAPVRDSQLAIPLNWLEQVISLRRDLALGRKAAEFLRGKVEVPLRERSAGRAPELDWFSYGLCRWALTVCNHRGALAEAGEEVARIERLVPSLAGRWEHFTLLTEGLIARAVHQTDCFRFAEASEGMRRIAERYEALAKAFSEAGPVPGQPSVRSDLRGKALGTWLQSEILAGPLAGEALARARGLSDAAAAEFLSEDDRERQWQYRCHLETLAGDFDAALAFLARSLKAAPSHASVASAVADLAGEPVEQGFALMHWLRLCSAMLLSPGAARGGAAEAEAALEGFDPDSNPWCCGQNVYYPAHSILRHLAVIRASRGAGGEALRLLGLLRRLCLSEEDIGVAFILLAAQAEVAALLSDKDLAAAARLLDSDSEGEPGVLQLAASLRAKTEGRFPEMARLAAAFSSNAEGPDGEGAPRERLLALGRTVRY
ncbi:MAG TPA: hypothetical protein VJ866_10005 [Pyrinomonadaceae bacterium]|nr:hypothetical protein [Pyrinomonadaceae bacterium]